MFSDEARFGNNVVINRPIVTITPKITHTESRTAHFQNVYSINVWAGILSDYVIGPYFFEGNLTGHRYRQFLENDFLGLLENAPLNLRQELWFQEDRASPHYHRVVRDYLDEMFANKWIGRSN